jgi:hypothetical protein
MLSKLPFGEEVMDVFVGHEGDIPIEPVKKTREGV